MEGHIGNLKAKRLKGRSARCSDCLSKGASVTLVPARLRPNAAIPSHNSLSCVQSAQPAVRLQQVHHGRAAPADARRARRPVGREYRHPDGGPGDVAGSNPVARSFRPLGASVVDWSFAGAL